MIPGGSNILVWQIGAQTPGLLAAFHLPGVAQTVEADLRTMYANGQRWLRIPVPFFYGPTNGFEVDATGGDLAQPYKQNLADLIALAKSIGFIRFIISFHPQANAKWQNWNPAVFNPATFRNSQEFQDYWNVVASVNLLLAASGVDYILDPLNEGIDDPANQNEVLFLKTLHGYVRWDKMPTCGYSIMAWPGLVAGLPAALGGDIPDELHLHIYGPDADPQNNAKGWGSAYSDYCNLDTDLKGIGFKGQVVVGECYYLPAAADVARQFQQAFRDTGRQPIGMLYWPNTPEQVGTATVKTPRWSQL